MKNKSRQTLAKPWLWQKYSLSKSEMNRFTVCQLLFTSQCGQKGTEWKKTESKSLFPSLTTRRETDFTHHLQMGGGGGDCRGSCLLMLCCVADPSSFDKHTLYAIMSSATRPFEWEISMRKKKKILKWKKKFIVKAELRAGLLCSVEDEHSFAALGGWSRPTVISQSNLKVILVLCVILTLSFCRRHAGDWLLTVLLAAIYEVSYGLFISPFKKKEKRKKELTHFEPSHFLIVWELNKAWIILVCSSVPIIRQGCSNGKPTPFHSSN